MLIGLFNMRWTPLFQLSKELLSAQNGPLHIPKFQKASHLRFQYSLYQKEDKGTSKERVKG